MLTVAKSRISPVEASFTRPERVNILPAKEGNADRIMRIKDRYNFM
jgi:hypothetical protein